jgi:hypothetical protein
VKDGAGTVAEVGTKVQPGPIATRRTAAIGVAAAVGVWAVAAAVDPTHGPILCPFRIATGLDCPLCGGTRALHALATGHPGRALDHNLLVGIAVPILVVLLAVVAVATLRAQPTRVPRPTRAVWIGCGIAVLAFWVLRNLPALAWLGSG